MNAADAEVLQAAHAWLAEGRRVALATVVHTFGSAPRPIGSLLALSEDGRLCGSVSGGCVEEDLLERVRGAFPAMAELLRYGVSADEARRFGLPCGGTLELVLEPLHAPASIDPVLHALSRRETIVRILDLETGRADFRPAAADDPECAYDGRTLLRVFGPRWRMLVIGAGQIGRYLAELAAGLDYQVFICEPREEYARSWADPRAELLVTMPDDAVRALAPDARTVVVALTHDPRLDELALMEALRSDAFYVGALGSRENQAKRWERLLELGLDREALERLHGPVGLPLGGKTPAEIALAVMAEVTALRHGVVLVRQGAETARAHARP